MKQTALSRRAFLLGLGAVSSAALLSACNTNAPVSDDEIKAYIKRAYDKYPHGQLESLTLDVDGEDVGIHYGLAPVKFDRIRRITGYLVGTLDRFNDAKRAEEHDRVKHEVPACCK